MNYLPQLIDPSQVVLPEYVIGIMTYGDIVHSTYRTFATIISFYDDSQQEELRSFRRRFRKRENQRGRQRFQRDRMDDLRQQKASLQAALLTLQQRVAEMKCREEELEKKRKNLELKRQIYLAIKAAQGGNAGQAARPN